MERGLRPRGVRHLILWHPSGRPHLGPGITQCPLGEGAGPEGVTGPKKGMRVGGGWISPLVCIYSSRSAEGSRIFL